MMHSGEVSGREEVDRALIAGLHSRRWFEAIDEIGRLNLDSDGRDRLAEAKFTTDRISQTLLEEQRRLSDHLGGSGIGAQAVSRSGRVDATVEISLAQAEVGKAIAVLDSLGFRPQREMSLGAISALARSSSELVLVPDNSPITRLIVRWDQKRRRTGLGGALKPSSGDLASVPLPEFAWWAYWPIHLARIAGRVFKRAPSSGSAPYVATPNDLIVPLLERVGVGPDDKVADLGCGDGRILIAAVAEFGCLGIGVESDERLAASAVMRIDDAGFSEKIELHVGDALGLDFSDVSVVFIFLPTTMAARIIPQLLEMLPDGARILAHEQHAVNWPVEPTESQLVIDPAGVTVAHIWVVERRQ